jgi:putative ABC transport system ATP-binding protein
MGESMSLIQLNQIAKTYGKGEEAVHALRATDLSIHEGKFCAIMGTSGSGKSTLLNILGMLDRPSAGSYLLEGADVANLNDNQRSDIRCRRIGIVFQSFNLMANHHLLENVCIPMRYARAAKKEMRSKGERLLERVGLADRMHHRPAQLSGGQKQRVAIARSLANDPAIVLADEPTGNLDEKTGSEILELFHELVAEGRTVVMITHNPAYESVVDRVVELRDGRIVRQ